VESLVHNFDMNSFLSIGALIHASSEHSKWFVVFEKEVRVVAEALQSRFRQALDNWHISQIAIIPNCSILEALGQKLASTLGISTTLFNALAKASINVYATQGFYEYNITVVVKREEKAADYRPKIIICRGSSYPRE
ncbi:hypothetical protein RYX36_021948, partial [Vicia faba]